MKRLLFLIFILSTLSAVMWGQYKPLNWYYNTSTLVATTDHDVTFSGLTISDLGTMAYADSAYIKSLITLKLNITDTSVFVQDDYLTARLAYYSPLAGSASITTVGALTSGSIGSGFTAIDTARTNALSYLWEGYGMALSARGKGFQLDADTTNDLVSKNYGGNQYQPKDADLTTYAGIAPSANAQTLLGRTFAQMRADIGASDSTLSRDTVYSNSVSKLTSSNTFAVIGGGGKAADIKIDTSKAASATTSGFMSYADKITQSKTTDSLTALRTEMDAKMDSINALRIEVAAIWAFIESLTSAPTYDTTNYYLSYSTGFDADNSGHNPNLPIKTFARLTALGLQAGDSVFLLTDDTWYESLTVSPSGTSVSPIVITSIGSGDTPVISGGEVLSGWVQNGNVWACHTTSTVYNLYVNGVQQTPAREPSVGNWYNVATGTSTVKLVSSEITGAEDAHVGALLAIRAGVWKYNLRTVVSSKDDSVTVSEEMDYTPSDGYGYYLQGLEAYMDTCREWWYDSADDSLYFRPSTGVNPNEQTCIASIRQHGISIAGSYVNIEGIQIEKQYSTGVNLTTTNQHVTINDCVIKDQYNEGLNLGSASYTTVSNTTITDCNGTGANAWTAGNSTFENDSLDRIGVVPGLAEQPFGILSHGDSTIIKGCRLDSIGYSGFYCGDYDEVYNNVVSNTLLVLEDGGAIYTTANHVHIYNNIVENVIGYMPSSNSTSPNTTVGIYLDRDRSENSRVNNNTIKGTMFSAIYVNYDTGNDTIDHNTIYDIVSPATATTETYYSRMIYINQDSDYDDWDKFIIKNNVFFSSDTSATPYRHLQVQDSAWFALTDVDENAYLNPYNKYVHVRHKTGATNINYNLTQWQDSVGEATVYPIWRQWWYGVQKDSLFVNKNSYSINYTIAENTWKDYEGTIHGTTLTVPPDSAILLFNSPDSDTLLVDYPESNYDEDGSFQSYSYAINFIGDGNYIGGFACYLKRYGSPGYYTPKLFSNFGTTTFGTTSRPANAVALAVGDSVSTDGYSTDYAWVNFYFTTPYKTTNGTIYHVGLTHWYGTADNRLVWGRDALSPSYAGNPSSAGKGTGESGWTAVTTNDPCFKIYTRPSP